MNRTFVVPTTRGRKVGFTIPANGTTLPTSLGDSSGAVLTAPGAESPSQEPRRGAIAEQPGSWSLEAPEGAYALIPAWTSGPTWFDAVLDALNTPEGAKKRRKAKVAPDTLLRVARADWEAADALTGRGVSTAHETVAAALGMSPKTVQRGRRLLELLGLAVTVVEGRYLTVCERKAARAAHGGRQLRAASLRALTMPRPVENVHLPRRGEVLKESLVSENSPTRAGARTTAAARPPALKMKKIRPSANVTTQPRPLELQRFAARLVDGDERDTSPRRLPWVLRSPDRGRMRHIGALCNVLSSAGIDPRCWRPREVIEAIDRWHQSSGRRTLAADAIDPLRYLAWQLAQAIDPTAPTPSEQARMRSAEGDARRAEREREATADRERMANVDRAAVARIIAQMKADAAPSLLKFQREKRNARQAPLRLNAPQTDAARDQRQGIEGNGGRA